MMLFHPLHTRLSIDFRTGEGRGGQRDCHNVSYIGSSFLTTWSPDAGLFQLDPLEQAGLMAIGRVLTIGELFCWTHVDCFQNARPTLACAKHLLFPIEYADACPTTLYQLDDDCQEVELIIEDGFIVKKKPTARPLKDTSVTTVIVPAGSTVRIDY